MEQIWALSLEPGYVGRGVHNEIVAFLKARTLGNSEKGLARMAGEILTAPDRVDELAKHCADAACAPSSCTARTTTCGPPRRRPPWPSG